MKKNFCLLLIVIFMISFTAGCSGYNASGAASPSVTNSQAATEKPSIDEEKLDTTMAILDAYLEETLGSDYSLVYDKGGIVISFWKEGAANAVFLAKNGHSEYAEAWGSLIDSMKELTNVLHDILEESDLKGIIVSVRCFDSDNKDTALAIAVDGKVTYNAAE
ncbi:MAG: hypothetical protein K6E42_00550 [Synergistes sp.]|nr:hypothetical protein [Synergistes sp.]